MVRDRSCARLTLLAAGIVVSTALDAAAQPIGAFRWQLLPYCNVITLNVTVQGTVFTLDGYDDQCGAGQRASAVGTAFPNLDGTIGIGLNVVVAPGGAFVHIDARISLSSLMGPWHDSSGNSGTFAFGIAADSAANGPPRPVSANGIAPGSITAGQLAPGSITTAQLAPGVIGGAQIDPNQVQSRIQGTCPVGQYLRGILANGAVICEPLLAVNVSNRLAAPMNHVGQFTSIAIGADGVPVIAYYNETLHTLDVTHCGNTACSAGVRDWRVDFPAGVTVGQYTSMAIGAAGFPIISHWMSGRLRVTHCNSADCTSSTNTTIADTDHSAGQYTSIAVGTDLVPVISHWDATAAKLRVTYCGNADCSAVPVSTTIDDTANSVGLHTSIAIGADEMPVISHWDATALAVRVTHCGNKTCTAGNVSTIVDDPANVVGEYTSIAIGIDGLPIISYWDQTEQALRVTHCGNAACTAGNVSTTVDNPVDHVGQYTAIAIGTDGLPVIAHWNATRHAVRVTHCGNAACTAGNVSTTVDDAFYEADGHIAMAIGADGLPIISYWEQHTKGLRVTKCATRTCQ